MIHQPSLFDVLTAAVAELRAWQLPDRCPPRFDGATFEPERDGERLAQQLGRVRELMRDGQWRTLRSIAVVVGAPEASVSARLRDLRKIRHGSWTVERRYVSRGLFEYRVVH